MTAQLDQTDLLDRAARLVEAAKRAGADAADALSIRRVALSVDVRLGKVEETTRAEGDDFTLRVFVGKRNASVSANVLGNPAELAERAVAMAKVAPEDKYAGLADPERLALDPPDLDLLDTTIPSVDRLTEMAAEAEAAALAVPGITNSAGGSARWGLAGLVLATSTGFCRAHIGSNFALSCTAIGGEGTGMERDYEYALKTHMADLPTPAEVGRLAAERTLRRLNAGSIPTGRMTVVYDPRVATSLIGHIAGAANGTAVARGTTFLSRSLGEAILPASFRITDDPLRKRALGSRPFDGEGVASQAFDLVTGGVLKTWLLDSATARELGLETNGRASRAGASTAPGVTNLTLLPGDISPEDLIAGISDGFYVTDILGAGVNLISGDYSRGASGLRIRNGQFAEAVTELTMAGTLQEMFRNITVANDLEYRMAVNSPTVAVEGMIVAGR